MTEITGAGEEAGVTGAEDAGTRGTEVTTPAGLLVLLTGGTTTDPDREAVAEGQG
jgi:hypothetical protein